MDKVDIKSSMMRILTANIINMVFGIISGFLLPKYLSIETYTNLKTYQLYISFIGIFHLGYADGVYLLMGGKDLYAICQDGKNYSLSTFRLFQLIVQLLCIGVGILLKNKLLIIFGVSIMPANIVSYFKSLFQSVGEFKVYSRILNLTVLLYTIFNIIFLFVIKTDNAYLYMCVYIVTDIILWITLENMISRRTNSKFRFFDFSLTEMFKNIRAGFVLMIGNLSSILLNSMDRWFIKILLTGYDFAQYSFAVSMDAFLNMIVTPIAVVMYNYFCKAINSERTRHVRNQVMIIGAILIAMAFPMKFIIEMFLEKYVDSVTVLFILIGAQMPALIVKGIYNNLYKAQKRQNKFFIQLVIIIILNVILNTVFYLVYPANESFAIGTLISMIIWLCLCVIDYKEITCSVNEVLYFVLQFTTYFVCGWFMSAITGFITYMAISMVLSFTLMKEDLKSLAYSGIAILKRRNVKNI